jgi:pimeloyl-ACP methyl ester carboxylesterase
MSQEPIIFIPGLNCTGELFAPQLSALSSSRRCQVARHGDYPDLRTAAGAIINLAPERFALVGLSMGGYLAFEVMRQAADRVTRLALMDTRVDLDTADEQEQRLALIEMAENGQFDQIHDIMWPRLVHADRHGDAKLEEVVKRMATDTGPEKFVRQQRAIIGRMNYQMTLQDIHCPTLVLVGEQDAISPPSHSRTIAASIAGAMLMILPECGHLATLEQPVAVNVALGRWLAQKASV